MIERRALRPTADGEVRVRVGACCLCGSELRQWRNGWPTTPGHEVAGRVEQSGHALDGRAVAVYIPVFCGSCPECATGATNVCRNASDLIGWQRDGGYAEVLNVPEQCLLPVPDDIPLDLAPLLLDVVGTGAHGARLARRVVKTGPALVLGGGPIGLGAAIVLRHFGLGPVDIVEPVLERQVFAESIDLRVVSAEDLDARYPIVIEASGKDAARQLALDKVAPLGAVVQLGEAERWLVEETKAIRRKDFFYIRSFYFPKAEFEENVAIFRSERAHLARFVDERVDLEQLPELFQRFSQGLIIKPAVTFEFN